MILYLTESIGTSLLINAITSTATFKIMRWRRLKKQFLYTIVIGLFLIVLLRQIDDNNNNRHNINKPVLEPRICGSAKFPAPKTIVIIKSSAEEKWKSREHIRQTWASLGNVKNHRFSFVFVLSLDISSSHPPAQVPPFLEAEVAEYGDLLIADLTDGRKTDSYKAVAAIDWISKKCSGSSYTVMTTERIFLNVFLLQQLLDGEIHSDGESVFSALSLSSSFPDSTPSLIFLCSLEDTFLKFLSYALEANVPVIFRRTILINQRDCFERTFFFFG